MRIIMPLVLALGLITATATALTHAANTEQAARQVNNTHEALKAADGARAILNGQLVKRLDNKHFVLRDASGEIKVEIDPVLLRTLSLSDRTQVELRGKIDKGWRGPEVEIDSIRVVTSQG
ncbi:YgiW/YdeI family stress tolerance OB fold protein [Shewanella zhangzhouensis]|uniref:YgiW/YdeI family stress tolerance OB fold protein n=1 Tax=Shewanella zhangzhouensis TaxID=2864213 RepID=UPI001C65501C|nr:NirD/YgiW/YdeI family stress tolerance protein [Shewanella zhangzhouensis]QYK05155.1 NirD/YgiW/YdeI family stress tolerance protein [Shewanella zhangzhouensis]